MKVLYFALFICSCLLLCTYSHLLDETISLLPLDNNLIHVEIKLQIKGNLYKRYLPNAILKLLTYVKHLKINIKRGVYNNSYNNRYLNSYPYGFTLVTKLKKNTHFPFKNKSTSNEIYGHKTSTNIPTTTHNYYKQNTSNNLSTNTTNNSNTNSSTSNSSSSSSNSSSSSSSTSSSNTSSSNSTNHDATNITYENFTEQEIYLLKKLSNDIWDITGAATNLLKGKDFQKIGKQIFAFMPEESICTDHIALIKKLYPCNDFGGVFNILDPKYFISRRFSNIGFELNDNEDNEDNEKSTSNMDSIGKIKNLFVLYVDYITEYVPNKEIRILDLLHPKYKVNECPLINRTAVLVKKKKKNGIIQIVEEKYKNIDVLYETINFATLPNTSYYTAEEYVNLNIYKEEANSMITTDIKRKQSSLLYIFQNNNESKKSDFIFVDILPYYLSPLWHTLMIQGKKINIPNSKKQIHTSSTTTTTTTNTTTDPYADPEIDPNANPDANPDACNFLYFGYDALTHFPLSFQQIPTENNSPISSNSLHIHFQYVLPPQCEIILRFEVVKIHIRSFELPFDFERGLLLNSGILLEKKTFMPTEDDNYAITYTPPILIQLPLSDSSMPYNVMALSTCIIMLFFGFMFKITAKEEVIYV